MQQGMLLCNGVQTEVITEGRWVEEESTETKDQHTVLIIPGNPGVPEFYKEFITAVNSRLPNDSSTWVVGHAGHVQPPDELLIAMPGDAAWHDHYGLKGQLKHKADFIKSYVPKKGKLYLIGHSIGCWFILNMLKDASIADRVAKCYLLFPTIEHMADSPNGQFFNNFVSRITKVLLYLSWFFMILPLFLQRFLIRAFGIFYGIPSRCTTAVLQLLHPEVLKRVFRLAKEEMRNINERDDDIISKHVNKLWFYYGTTDGWVPVKYYEVMKSKHPNVEAELCKRAFYHSFVLSSATDMGHIVGDLINEDMSKS